MFLTLHIVKGFFQNLTFRMLFLIPSSGCLINELSAHVGRIPEALVFAAAEFTRTCSGSCLRGFNVSG
jgi:hypothetical protein